MIRDIRLSHRVSSSKHLAQARLSGLMSQHHTKTLKQCHVLPRKLYSLEAEKARNLTETLIQYSEHQGCPA
jgi:hypothetical protein